MNENVQTTQLLYSFKMLKHEHLMYAGSAMLGTAHKLDAS